MTRRTSQKRRNDDGNDENNNSMLPYKRYFVFIGSNPCSRLKAMFRDKVHVIQLAKYLENKFLKPTSASTRSQRRAYESQSSDDSNEVFADGSSESDEFLDMV